MRQGLSLRMSQHLALTPQLQQSIRLLQLSTLELDQEVEQMLADNPFLEVLPDEAVRESFGLPQSDTAVHPSDRAVENAVENAVYSATDRAGSEDADESVTHADDMPGWDGDGSVTLSADDSEWGCEAPARGVLSDDDAADGTEWAHSQESLQSALHTQAASLRLGDADRAALFFLIESLNDDGYLTDSLIDLARGLAGADDDAVDDLLHHLTVAQGLLHHLEPAGVGAHSLAECLRLQLRAMAVASHSTDAGHDAHTVQVALGICDQPLVLLARRDVKQLAALCQATEAEVRAAMTLIGRLEPRPGRRFCCVERNTVVPDVLVVPARSAEVPATGGEGSDTGFEVRLNPDVMPRLRVHDVYANAIRGYKSSGRDAAGHAALQQRLQEARWFIKNIQQRFDTILRVSMAIVARQKNFLVHGDLAMRPLVLREIADELGLHESTISRVTSAKYMSTPQGTYELKYFFGSGLGTESGGSASSTAVRALIKQFIAAENPQKPLSDSQLAEMLKEQGIDCARRTVAKYRESLKIATAGSRKSLT